MAAERIAYIALKHFPKDLVTSIAGKLAGMRLPSIILIPAIRLYSSVFGANMAESEKKASEFTSFNEFFARKLKQGARKVRASKNAVISPVDGIVSGYGVIRENILLQAKGKQYTLESLLKNTSSTKTFRGGNFITIYLRPGDYHRIHAPLSGIVRAFSYIPGALFPVNRIALNSVPELFPRNERLITYMDTGAGKIAIVKIGACIVGRIRVNYTDLVFRHSFQEKLDMKYGKSHAFEKGDELGMFEIGSTVILLFEKGAVKFRRMNEGKKVLMGEKIADIVVSRKR